MFKTELLSPAGTLKNMRYAFAYGADAVYAGQPRYSLRVRNNEFNHENLALGIQETHSQGKKFYLVVNIAPHNSKLKTFLSDMRELVALRPDALIISDPGLILLTREAFPDMPLHLSVQANAVNWASVKFWHLQGISRVILSRELSLEEIEEISQRNPEMELEVFVHGALCMAYSGRCLLSGYINKRDANQGTCTNACRWDYKVRSATTNLLGEIVARHELPAKIEITEPTLGLGQSSDQLYLLEQPQRPGEEMGVFEDQHGTYIMNSKDLRAVEHVERLVKMGLHSLKIEGRTKSFYYCARTAQVYRQAIDDAASGRPFNPLLMQQLEALANRGYTEGFLRRHKHEEYQNYAVGHSTSRQQFVGELTGERRNGLAEVKVKNRFSLKDAVELMTPNGNLQFQVAHLENLKEELIEVAPGDGHTVYLKVPEEVELDYALLIRQG